MRYRRGLIPRGALWIFLGCLCIGCSSLPAPFLAWGQTEPEAAKPGIAVPRILPGTDRSNPAMEGQGSPAAVPAPPAAGKPTAPEAVGEKAQRNQPRPYPGISLPNILPSRRPAPVAPAETTEAKEPTDARAVSGTAQPREDKSPGPAPLRGEDATTMENRRTGGKPPAAGLAGRGKAAPAAKTPPARPGETVRPAPFNDADDVGIDRQQRGEASREQEQDLMEEALTLLNRSEDAWCQGNLETALEMLDQAYAMILDADGDPDIARQKDDLRLLISRRILALYSTQQTGTNGRHSEIPLVINADVEKEIRLFQTVERDFFVASFERSGLYRSYIAEELRRAGLPEELSWLPLVESGFKISALSPARALGLWQFIPSTGYKYGLTRDDWIDERMDVQKATRAAIDYLRDLHQMFGDWLTVLAAYNCGEGRVMKVISGQHINYFDRFWDLYNQLPYETARYVPRFLATLLIIRDPAKYGMDLRQDNLKPSLFPCDLVKTQRSMRLQDIARHAGLPEDATLALNAELRHRMTPEREYALKLPLDGGEKFAAVAEEIPSCERPRLASRPVLIKYRVKKGETLESIAAKYNLSPRTVLTYNRMKSGRSIRAGRVIRVPLYEGRGAQVAQRSTAGTQARTGEPPTTYKVKRGDTLSALARQFNTTAADLTRINNLPGSMIRVGQVLRITAAVGETPAGKTRGEGRSQAGRKRAARTNTVSGAATDVSGKGKTYAVVAGDSLGRIARTQGTTVGKLRQLNNLSRNETIHPGQVLFVR